MAKPAWSDLRIEAALALELPASRSQDALLHHRRRFTSRFGGELSERNAPDADLEIDAVEQRA